MQILTTIGGQENEEDIVKEGKKKWMKKVGRYSEHRGN